MAAQKGKDIAIKIGDGAGPEVFTTVAGLRTKTLGMNQEQVDITNSDSASQWRELLANGGVRSMSVSGSGVFNDSASEAAVRTAYEATTHTNFQFVVPDFGTFEGAFQVATIEYSGEYNGAVNHALTLESAGQISFTGA